MVVIMIIYCVYVVFIVLVLFYYDKNMSIFYLIGVVIDNVILVNDDYVLIKDM